MSDYSHLSTPIAETRYILAAHYLDAADHVVEVGGHRINDYLPHHVVRDRQPRHVWSIDPSAEPRNWERVKHYRAPVQHFNFDNTVGDRRNNGLCLLGLEMYDAEYGDGGIESLNHLCANVKHFDLAVMDYVPSNKTAQEQALVLWGALQVCGFSLTIRFGSDWIHDSKYKEPNASFGKHREFWVMEKQ